MQVPASETSDQRPNLDLAHLDLALGFAWSHRWRLLSLLILPLLIQLAVNYLLYVHPFSTANIFLLLVFVWVANGLLICTVTMFTIETFQRKTVSAKALLINAFRFLPKVLFSCIAVASLVLTFLIVPATTLSIGSLLFVGLAVMSAAFLLWAPAFCVGEFYAPIPDEDDLATDQADDELGEVTSIATTRVAPGFTTMKLFTKKHMWDLGMFRSARLAGINWHLTLKVLVLCWLAFILPAAGAEMLLGRGSELLTDSVAAIISRVLGVFVLAAWAVSFLQILPPGSRKEISLPVSLSADWFNQDVKLSRVTISNRKNLFFALAAVCLFCTWYVQNSNMARLQFPTDVQVENESTKFRNNEIILRLKLSDSKRQFRWFLPGSFRLELHPQGKTETEIGNPALASRLKFSPYKYEIRSQNGDVLDAENFRPHAHPLEVALYFDDVIEGFTSGKFKLFYSPSQTEEGVKVLEGDYSEQTVN